MIVVAPHAKASESLVITASTIFCLTIEDAITSASP